MSDTVELAVLEQNEIPEKVFVHVPEDEIALVTTLPQGFSFNPQNLGFKLEDIQPSNDEGFVIELSNDPQIATLPRPKTPDDFLQIIKQSRFNNMKEYQTIVDTMELIVNTAKQMNMLSKLTIDNLIQLFNGLLTDSQKDPGGMFKSMVLNDVMPKIKGGMKPINSSDTFTPIAIIYKRYRYVGDELKALQQSLTEETERRTLLNPLRININPDSYFYRAPRQDEWDEIKKNNGYWAMSNATNFVTEDNFNSGKSSTVIYMSQEGYAGVTIRFKPSLNVYTLFPIGGQNIIQSMVGHFVEVEYFDEASNEWRKFNKS